ncbi:MAG: sulfite exporter TauE/SafE family protein, partial [Alcanivorax sp.]
MVDMITLPWLLLGLFIFLAFTTEAATGFGSIVIALSLGALVLPITEILPVLVPLNIVMSSTLSWRHRH